MTMPNERARSVIDAAELLRDISLNLELPTGLRREAKRLLRHYPSAQDIDSVSQLENYIFSKTTADTKRDLFMAVYTPRFGYE